VSPAARRVTNFQNLEQGNIAGDSPSGNAALASGHLGDRFIYRTQGSKAA